VSGFSLVLFHLCSFVFAHRQAVATGLDCYQPTLLYEHLQKMNKLPQNLSQPVFLRHYAYGESMAYLAAGREYIVLCVHVC
jgi:hypothetical protein